MATYYAHVVRWIKEDPSSPGYAMAGKLVDALVSNNADNAIPPQFFDKDIYNEYFEQQVSLESFTDKSPGFVTFVHYKDVSAMVFDSGDNLLKYNTEKKELPTWSAFEKARDDFLALVKTRFEVLPMQTLTTNIADMAEIRFVTGARIDQLLTPAA